MVKKAALKTAGISMAGFQPRQHVFDGQTPATGEDSSAHGNQPRPPGKPFTGVGSVMAAITREADLSQELVGAQAALNDAKAELEQFRDAEVVQVLDPRSIRRSRWANRIQAEFETQEFAQLKNEIAGASGNVQPIKVRRIEGASKVFDGQTPVFEIVFGHRRHQACLELGLTVNAIVVSHMDDKALFEAMDRENRGRKNLSAWEQGRMYDEAIRQGLYPSLRRLSDSLGVNLSDASRAVQLAKLPSEVVAAFASPLDLQVRWAKPLADAMQRDPDGLLQRARALASAPTKRNASGVFAELLGQQQAQKATETPVMLGNRKVAVLRVEPSGRLIVEFEPGAVSANRNQDLVKTIKAFLASDSA